MYQTGHLLTGKKNFLMPKLCLFQCDVPERGLVPKSLYFNREEDEERDRSPEDSPFGGDSLYHTAYVMKDWPHEVAKSLLN